jgi:fatty-acid desaturase
MANQLKNLFAADLKLVRGLFFINVFLAFLLPLFNIVPITTFGILISILIYYTLGGAGIVATFHRFHSHNSFQFKKKWIEVLFTTLGSLTGSGSALGWAAMHRLHHETPDKVGDPHAPLNGVWPTLTVKYNYHKGMWKNIKDLAAKPYLVFLHKYYFLILFIYIAVLFGMFSLSGIYYGFIIPSTITLLLSGLTNYVSHIPFLGYQRHKDGGKATNAWWMSLFNCGEGWHNNHHHNPSSFTTKEKWWEWDMAGSIIRMVKK